MPDSPDDDGLAALELAYGQAAHERDRLRAARAFFARQLGPLPAFAGVSAALVGAFSDKIQHRLWMWIALGFLGLLILVSFVYSGLPAYRQLRAERERRWREELEKDFAEAAERAREAGLRVEDVLEPEDWYVAQIKLERGLYGDPGRRNRLMLPSWSLEDTDLLDQLDRERTGLFVSQVLFLVVIGFLFAARL
jgi:hypothetical protein